MVCETVKKWVGQDFIFHTTIPAHYIFLMKFLLVTLKNVKTLACLNLSYGTSRQ